MKAKILVMLTCIALGLAALTGCSRQKVIDVSGSSTVSASSEVSDSSSLDESSVSTGSEETSSYGSTTATSSNKTTTRSSQSSSKTSSSGTVSKETKGSWEMAAAYNPQPAGPYAAQVTTLRNKILNSGNSLKATGKTYYVSPNGDDFNDGLSPKTAWETPSQVSVATLLPGDVVLFERGAVFRGGFKTKEGVSYGAYGTGDKPQLYASRYNEVQKGFTATSTANIYRSNTTYNARSSDIGLVVFNHGAAWGIKKESMNALKSNFDFYHNPSDSYVYIYLDKGNPAKVYYDIEFGHTQDEVVSLDANNVTIENLCFKYAGGHLMAGDECSNVTIRYCEMGWIGGGVPSHATSRLRFGNAIQFWGNVKNITVDHCYVYQVYDSAITYQYTGTDVVNVNNIQFTNNLVEYSSIAFEYFLMAADGSATNGLKITDNICRLSGYGLGKQRSNMSEVGLICDRNSDNPITGYVISNNILDRATYTLYNIDDKNSARLPQMSGNTYVQNSGSLIGIWQKAKMKTADLIQSLEPGAKVTFIS